MKTTVDYDNDSSDAENNSTGTKAEEPFQSARYSLRIGSSLTELAKASTAADQAHILVLELISGTVLDEVIKALDTPVPEDGTPYRFATIAQSTANTDKESSGPASEPATEPAPGEGTEPASARGAEAVSGDRPATCIDTDPWSATYGAPLASKNSGTEAPSQMASSQQAETANGADDGPEANSEGSPEASPEGLPNFPYYSRSMTFFEWSRENVAPEDVAEAATILGTSVVRALRQLTSAMTVIHGLPRFAERARRGEFATAHVEAVAYLCVDTQFQNLPHLDDYLAKCRSSVTSDSLLRALRKILQLIQPREDCSQIASERRFVDVTNHRDGTASIRLWGPALEINASYDRVRAMAKAVRTDQVNTFNLPAGTKIVDDRDMQALMSDIYLRPQPKLNITVRRVDPVTGILSSDTRPLLDNEGTPLFDAKDTSASGLMAAAGFTDSTGSSAGSDSTFGITPQSFEGLDTMVSVEMPTHEYWLRNQAGLVATVPFLTLIGKSELPGILPDGSPIPADLARQLAGDSPSLTRILTDPATGTPLDAKATSYSIPKDLRRTLIAQWTTCTIPGCTRRAVNTEIDHVIPFFHLDPMKGGKTQFGNLHPLCKRHHALKTAKRYTVRMPESGLVEYEFRHGVKARNFAPDQPINVAQAQQLNELCNLKPRRWRVPKHKVPPPPRILELMPGESTLRERAEARRAAEEEAARQCALQERFEHNRAERHRQMLEQSLDWDVTRLQKELPPGPNPVTMKQLGPGKYTGYWRKPDRYIADRFAHKLINGHIWVDKPARPKPQPRIQWEHDPESDPPPF